MTTRLTIALCPDLAAAERAAVPGWDLLVLPELTDGGYAALAAGSPPHTLRSPVVQRLRELSRRTGGTVVGGSLALARPGLTPANTALVFRRGRRVARYEKIHLFRPAGDRRYFRAGRRPCAFRLRGSLLGGVIICYDLRFPELARLLALRGVRVLAVPARWPRARADAWRTLLRARAIENQIFVAGCNARGGEGGPSFVMDPFGREVRRRPGVGGRDAAVFTADLRLLTRARRLQDTLREVVLLRRTPRGQRRRDAV